jgi:hypothetical protein
MTFLHWVAIGVVLTVFLLAMDEQREGASLVLLAGVFLGPLMLFFIVLRYIGQRRGL